MVSVPQVMTSLHGQVAIIVEKPGRCSQCDTLLIVMIVILQRVSCFIHNPNNGGNVYRNVAFVCFQEDAKIHTHTKKNHKESMRATEKETERKT